MTKVNQNIGTNAASPFLAGTDKTIEITVEDEDNGGAFNLTGVTVIQWRMFGRLKDAGFTGDALISKSLGSGVTVTDAAGGVFEVALVPADTTGKGGTFYHEAHIVDSGGRVAKPTIGKVEITPSAI